MKAIELLYRFVISIWFGGGVLLTFLLTPTLFRSLDRDQAGQIVGILFPGYFRWEIACGLIALTSILILKGRHMVTSAVLVVAMLAMTSFQAFYIEPKARELKQGISFVTTPADHPQRVAFKKLHAVSAIGNLGVIGGGAVLLLLL